MTDAKTKRTVLTHAEVKHIAKLANLRLSPSEIRAFSEQLSEVLSYIDKLQEVDTSATVPTTQIGGLVNVFRDDRVEKSLSQDEALSNAKRKYNGYFATERVI